MLRGKGETIFPGSLEPVWGDGPKSKERNKESRGAMQGEVRRLVTRIMAQYGVASMQELEVKFLEGPWRKIVEIKNNGEIVTDQPLNRTVSFGNERRTLNFSNKINIFAFNVGSLSFRKPEPESEQIAKRSPAKAKKKIK